MNYNSESTITESTLSRSTSCRNVPIDNQKLNFTEGTAAFCIDAIVSEKDLQLAREKIKGEHQKGKTIREQLQAAKRVTSGVVFGSGTTRLGKTVFDICQENVDMKKQDIIDMMVKSCDILETIFHTISESFDKKR